MLSIFKRPDGPVWWERNEDDVEVPCKTCDTIGNIALFATYFLTVCFINSSIVWWSVVTVALIFFLGWLRTRNESRGA